MLFDARKLKNEFFTSHRSHENILFLELNLFCFWRKNAEENTGREEKQLGFASRWEQKKNGVMISIVSRPVTFNDATSKEN